MSTRSPTDCSTAWSFETAAQRTVLVTGGSGGIGRAVCLAFARAGWTVGVHYFSRPDEAATTLALVREASPQSSLYQADIRLTNEVKDMVELFIQEHGRLHTMICNAGTAAAHFVLRHQADAWQRVIETNLTGTFHCLQAAAATMVTAGGGSLIVVGSYAGAQGDKGQAAYASAKAGLLGLIRTAALEWGPFNIRINLVYPGLHRTSLQTVGPDGQKREDHVLGRSPELEEVARTICHLAHLNDISGQVWNMDSRFV
jgi:3-oxoacyl-[acyl-carrier protein] reductase